MIAGYYTTKEIMSKFGWSRQQVSATARREGWKAARVGNANLYAQSDVDEYALARKRTDLAIKLGVSIKGLLRRDEYDFPCEVCGGFAIVLPVVSTLKRGRSKAHDAAFDAALDRYIKYLSGNDEDDYPWLCENGHGSE